MFLAAFFPIAIYGVDIDGNLVADGNSEQTYQLITASGYMYECPDVSRDHATFPFQHIQQVYDEDLARFAFQFFIHAKIDDDRGIEATTDRQRNEIKTWGKSPSFMVGQSGDSLEIRWKFKLPVGMLTTKKFTHVHQLKGIDNQQGTADVANPLVTFTCCTTGNGDTQRQEMQIRYVNREDGSIVRLAEIDMSLLMGRWVDVVECVRIGEHGCYSLIISDVDTGNVLLRVKPTSCNLWCDKGEGVRPKWGIYRYIGEQRSLENELRDEELRFTDFSIRKVGISTRVDLIQDGEHRSAVGYDMLGRVVSPIFSINGKQLYIYKGKKVLR